MSGHSLLSHDEYADYYTVCYFDNCCEGLCGEYALNCYCDDSCISLGDCCDDYCDECGGCPPNYIEEIECGAPPALGSTCGYFDTLDYECDDDYCLAPDVAYSFTLQESGPVTISTCGSSFNTFLRLFTDAGGFTYGEEISSCDDCGGCDGMAELELSSLPPGDYLVVVDGSGGECGDYQLQITCGDSPDPPVNYIDALICGGSPALGSTCGYSDTLDPQDYDCNGDWCTAPDVAYSFTLQESTPVTISTCGSSFDTFLHLYTDGGGFTYGELISSCDDCGGCGLMAVLELSSLPP
eukprot:scaffold5384_cov242-Prasinococcus_capsulatus_cf.AAC.4